MTHISLVGLIVWVMLEFVYIIQLGGEVCHEVQGIWMYNTVCFR